MNRRVEGIMNLVAVRRAKIHAEIEALGALGKGLERITYDEADTLSLDDWGVCKETADKIEGQRIEALRALGILPPFVPGAAGSKVFQGIGLARSSRDGSEGGRKSAQQRAERIERAATLAEDDEEEAPESAEPSTPDQVREGYADHLDEDDAPEGENEGVSMSEEGSPDALAARHEQEIST